MPLGLLWDPRVVRVLVLECSLVMRIPGRMAWECVAHIFSFLFHSDSPRVI